VKLSHLDEASRARMVDVGGKPESERTATAEGMIRMSREAGSSASASTNALGPANGSEMMLSSARSSSGLWAIFSSRA